MNSSADGNFTAAICCSLLQSRYFADRNIYTDCPASIQSLATTRVVTQERILYFLPGQEATSPTFYCSWFCCKIPSKFHLPTKLCFLSSGSNTIKIIQSWKYSPKIRPFHSYSSIMCTLCVQLILIFYCTCLTHNGQLDSERHGHQRRVLQACGTTQTHSCSLIQQQHQDHK